MRGVPREHLHTEPPSVAAAVRGSGVPAILDGMWDNLARERLFWNFFRYPLHVPLRDDAFVRVMREHASSLLSALGSVCRTLLVSRSFLRQIAWLEHVRIVL